MAPIPLPKRSLRGVVVLLIVLLGPFLVVRHLSSIPGPSNGYGSYFRADRLVVGREDDHLFPEMGKWWEDTSAKIGGREEPAVGARLANQDHVGAAGKAAGGRAVQDVVKGRAPPAGKGKKKANARFKGKLAQHKYRDDGLLVVNSAGRHPIYDLLEKAKENWEGKLARASKTLGQAVNEYRRRYGRAPPRGFDRWWVDDRWAAVRLAGSSLISGGNTPRRTTCNYRTNTIRSCVRTSFHFLHPSLDLFLIALRISRISANPLLSQYQDLDPFYALTPATLQKLVAEAAAKSGMYTIYCPGMAALEDPDLGINCVYDINEEGVTPGHLAVAKERAEAQLSLLTDIQEELEEVEAVFYSHDVPWQFVGHEYVSRARCRRAGEGRGSD
jgi:hypothetical protein